MQIFIGRYVTQQDLKHINEGLSAENVDIYTAAQDAFEYHINADTLLEELKNQVSEFYNETANIDDDDFRADLNEEHSTDDEQFYDCVGANGETFAVLWIKKLTID